MIFQCCGRPSKVEGQGEGGTSKEDDQRERQNYEGMDDELRKGRGMKIGQWASQQRKEKEGLGNRVMGIWIRQERDGEWCRAIEKWGRKRDNGRGGRRQDEGLSIWSGTVHLVSINQTRGCQFGLGPSTW